MVVVRVLLVVAVVMWLEGLVKLRCLVCGGWSVTFVVFAVAGDAFALVVFESVIWCGRGFLVFGVFVLFHEALLDDDLGCAD